MSNHRYSPAENVTRQEALYSFLLQRGDHWTSMEQTTDSISLYPTYYRGIYHNSVTRRLLTADIEIINGNPRYEKIIVSGARGIKLANEEEFERFIDSELREVFRKLQRVRRIARKGTSDQQIDMEGTIADAFIGRE